MKTWSLTVYIEVEAETFKEASDTSLGIVRGISDFDDVNSANYGELEDITDE